MPDRRTNRQTYAHRLPKSLTDPFNLSDTPPKTASPKPLRGSRKSVKFSPYGTPRTPSVSPVRPDALSPYVPDPRHSCLPSPATPPAPPVLSTFKGEEWALCLVLVQTLSLSSFRRSGRFAESAILEDDFRRRCSNTASVD